MDDLFEVFDDNAAGAAVPERPKKAKKDKKDRTKKRTASGEVKKVAEDQDSHRMEREWNQDSQACALPPT